MESNTNQVKRVSKQKYYHHEWENDSKGHQGAYGCTGKCKKCGKILVSIFIGNHPYSPWKTCKVKGMFDN